MRLSCPVMAEYRLRRQSNEAMTSARTPAVFTMNFSTASPRCADDTGSSKLCDVLRLRRSCRRASGWPLSGRPHKRPAGPDETLDTCGELRQLTRREVAWHTGDATMRLGAEAPGIPVVRLGCRYERQLLGVVEAVDESVTTRSDSTGSRRRP